MRKIALPVLVLLSGISLATDQSPYAGEELRSLKSLSSQEIESLRSGQGMGVAKLAELNHYPGPKHVLDLANDLDLTPFQVVKTEELFELMRISAVDLGEELLKAEMDLNQNFERRTITPGSLERELLQIGRIRAQLRYVHLEAHLRQQRLLTAEQIAKYDEIRGYRGTAHDHKGHPKTAN
jgi:ribosomal protein S13